MKVLAVEDLKPSTRLGAPIYDKTGQELLAGGEFLGRERIRMLSACDIRVVFVPEPDEDVAAFFGEQQNVPVEIERLEVGGHTTKPLLDLAGVLLLKEDAQITPEFIESFRRRGLRFLYVEQTAAEREVSSKQIEEFRLALEADRRGRMEAQLGKSADIPVEFAPEELVADPAEIEPEKLGQRIEEELKSEREEAGAGPPPEEDSFEREIKPLSKEEMRSKDQKELFLDAYAGMVAELKKIYDALRKGQAVTSGSIGKVVGEAMVIIRDIELFLSLAARPQIDDPCVAHAVRVGLFSLAAGLARRYDRKRIFELAHSAFLIDIGMLRVDEKILRKKVRLTDPERAEIRRHVTYGLEMARSVSGVPWLSACTIYQSHERGDGSGYPQGRKAEDIIVPARIVAAADVYAALTEERPHRPALLPYRAMEMLLRMGSINWLDPAAIRGILRYLSLFPLGSWAELSTGEKVRVVSSNVEDYTRPVVSVVYNRKGAPVEPFRINLIKHPQIRIRTALPSQGLEPDDDPLLGF